MTNQTDELIRAAQLRAEREAASYAEKQHRECCYTDGEIAQIASDHSFVYDQGEYNTPTTAGLRAVYETVFRARVR